MMLLTHKESKHYSPSSHTNGMALGAAPYPAEEHYDMGKDMESLVSNH